MVQAGAAEICSKLLAGGCQVDAVNTTGATALYCAAAAGHAAVVDVLLLGGAEVDVVVGGEMTALHAAVSHGKIEVGTWHCG